MTNSGSFITSFAMDGKYGTNTPFILILFFLLLPVSSFAQSSEDKNATPMKGSGYVNFTGLDMLPGDEGTSYRLQMINGYRFTPYFSVGIGLGYTAYSQPLDAVPFFLDLRLKITNTPVAPFVSVKAGYSFSVLHDDELSINEHKGGFLFNPGMGLQFTSHNGFGWYFNAGYNMEKLRYEQETWNNRTLVTKLSYRRIMFGLGFSF